MSTPKELEQVMKMRGGSVLGKRTILKSDHFPGCQNKRLTPQIDGAPNYRHANSLRVHGVAIPTIEGIQNVLKHIGAQKDGKRVQVLWFSLRDKLDVTFLFHTRGFGGVSYAMAIICLRLDAEANFASKVPQSFVDPHLSSTYEENIASRTFDEEACRIGDYRDILNLTRVLVYGPQSKADVDIVIENEELTKLPNEDDEHGAYLKDMGIKALRRYFFLITFRSYLYCTSPAEIKFKSWMDGRPELGHLCNNLRIDK